MLSIGEMAQLNGVTPRTLRFYATKGLLEPAYVDMGTGFRHYDIRQCCRLDRIQELQSLGCSLDEVAEVMADAGDEAYRNLLRDKAAQCREELRVAQERIALIDVLLKKERIVGDLPPVDTPRIERLPSRAVIRVDTSGLDPARAAEGYGHVCERWEYLSRKIKRDLLEQGYPVALLLNASCGISKESLLSGDFVFDRFFLFVDDIPLDESFDREELPAGDYGVVYSAGSVGDDGTYKTPKNIVRLLDYAREQGYEVAGDYLDELLGETIGPDGGRVMTFRMLVPLAPRTPVP